MGWVFSRDWVSEVGLSARAGCTLGIDLFPKWRSTATWGPTTNWQVSVSPRQSCQSIAQVALKSVPSDYMGPTIIFLRVYDDNHLLVN